MPTEAIMCELTFILTAIKMHASTFQPAVKTAAMPVNDGRAVMSTHYGQYANIRKILGGNVQAQTFDLTPTNMFLAYIGSPDSVIMEIGEAAMGTARIHNMCYWTDTKPRITTDTHSWRDV